MPVEVLNNSSIHAAGWRLTMQTILSSPKPVPPPAPKKPEHNEVIYVIDSSGSMSGCWETAKKKLAESARVAGEKSKEIGQTTNVSSANFSYETKWDCKSVSADTAAASIERTPFQGGGTALNDAIADAISYASDREQIADALLIVIITDGGENTSKRYGHREGGYDAVANMIGRKQGTGKYTISFLCPPGTKNQICRNYSVPEGNVVEWENTDRGAREAGNTVSASLGGYYATRSTGATHTEKFIKETTDLSKVSVTQPEKKLDDVSDQFKVHTVAKQAVIKDFVEEKTKKPYALGTCFFQLMKPEKVQAGKEIMVMVKTGVDAGKLYAGHQARATLGIPNDNVKLTPGNHSNFEVFVQSTSVNRILPLGTKVLTRK
jgi:hypothetical protein